MRARISIFSRGNGKSSVHFLHGWRTTFSLLSPSPSLKNAPDYARKCVCSFKLNSIWQKTNYNNNNNKKTCTIKKHAEHVQTPACRCIGNSASRFLMNISNTPVLSRVNTFRVMDNLLTELERRRNEKGKILFVTRNLSTTKLIKRRRRPPFAHKYA